jgi:FkbM family methyltransferase
MNYFLNIPNNKFPSQSSGLFNLINIGAGTTYVQRKLIKDGLKGYEPETQAALCSLIDQIDDSLVFYDIGAHIGLYTLLISSIFAHKRISCFAFEPTPSTAEIAMHLRDLNRKSYTIVKKAVSSELGQINFYLSPKAETSNSLNPNFRPGGESIVVEQTTIDYLVSSGLPPPNIIKIDVETYEYQVLFGGLNTITNFRPFIICELLPNASSNNIEDSINLLRNLDYKIYSIRKDKSPELIKFDDLSKSRTHTHRDWLFAPNELPESYVKKNYIWRQKIMDCAKVFQLINDQP